MVLVSNRKKNAVWFLLSFVLRERFNLFPFIISYNFTIKAVKDEV